MAEKVELFELDINVNKALRDIADSQKEVAKLKTEIKDLQKAEGDNSKAIAEKTVQLKNEQKELRTNTTLTQNVIAANKANTGSIDQLRKQLSVVSVQWAKLSESERVNTTQGKKLTAQKLKLTNALKKEEKATGDTRRNVGNYGESVNSALGVTGQFIPVLGRASGAISNLGKVMKFALGPIGLLIAAIGLIVGALKTFFANSEEGENALNRLSATVTTVTDNIADRFAGLGEALIPTTEKFQEITDFFQNTFGNIITGALEKVRESFARFFNSINLGFQRFKNLFIDNAEAIEEASNDIIENNKKIEASNAKIEKGVDGLKDAYDDVKESVKDFIEEQEREIKIAQRLADQQASLDKQIRGSIIANARDLEKVAKLRNQVAQRENFTNEERLKFLDEAIKLEEQILQRNLSIARQKAFIKIEQNKLSNSTKADLDEEARLRAEIFNVRTRNFEKTRRLELERSALVKQIAKEESDILRKAAQEETDIFLALAAQEKQQAEQDLQIQKSLAENKKILAEQEAERRRIEFDAAFEAAQFDIERRTELELQSLEEKRQREIAFAESIGAETTNIEKKFSLARQAINQAETDAKLSLAGGFAKDIATIAGEGTAIGKAAAATQATVSAFQAANGAYAALAGIPIVGPALGVVAAGAALVAGFRNVKEILSTKSGLPGDTTPSISTPTGGGGSTTPVVRPESVAPGVNQGIISRQTISNQQDQLTQQPILVVDEVTAAQNVKDANIQTSEI
jgi:hypothetical protein